MKQLSPPKLPVPRGDRFSSIDPLDSRYYDEQIATYLSEESRIHFQAHIEAALAHALAEFKVCKPAVANRIERAARNIQAKDVYAEEQVTKHDIKALVNCLKKQLPDNAKPYVHFGATSYDIIASANALQLKTAMEELVIPRLEALVSTLINLTEQYADTIQIGRTHGQHAVPITFGFALAEYVSRLGTTTLALKDLTAQLSAKFSGAVGAYNALGVFVSDPIAFEKALLSSIGLKPAEFSTQIAPPEPVVRLIDELTIAAGIMANLGHDMRHLQRSEISEIRERFEKGQTGSSTMAHKRNPWNFENIVSVSKQVIAQSVNANLNLSSEHQRDLTDSASSRFYGVVLASVASMAARLNKVMQKIEVDEAAMQRNLQLTQGAIAAEPLYLLLAKHDHTEAHEKAKALAHAALETNLPLAEVIEQDAETRTYWNKFSPKEKRIITAPELHYTGLAAKKAHRIAKAWRSKLGK